MLFHSVNVEDVFAELKSSPNGLSRGDAVSRFGRYGPNEIKARKQISPGEIFFAQFKSFIVVILLAAVVISLMLGEMLDALVIGIILVVNTILGFLQEFKAEKAIEALKKLSSLKAVVIRDGKEVKVDAKELVPGDVIVLETGEKIPADARIFECVNLELMEASLTGESFPSVKSLDLSEKSNIAGQHNMVFSSTIVTNGRGKAVVVRTGMSSEIGKIADMIQKAKPELTPLQEMLKRLGETLGIITIVVCIVVFLVGILFGNAAGVMFIAAISLAVAAIPEGLPAIVTISLALGVQRMIYRNVLIRKLPSVETLGSTNVICTDKTGTLTHNEMTVRKLFVNDKIIDVSGSGYKAEGVFSFDNNVVDPAGFKLLFEIGVLCNDSKISEGNVVGDPTEAALIVSAAKAGVKADLMNNDIPRIGEIQFSSERKRMSTFHKMHNKSVVFTKGAPDVVLDLCDRILVDGRIDRLSKEDTKKILDINDQFASQALRVLGFAFKDSEKLDEDGLVFVGLQAMIDPPREEAKLAIAKCKSAGIRVIMITGDHKRTAEAIGKELGLEGKVVDGHELDSIVNLEEVVDEIAIYSRVDPRHKLRIVEALRAKGYVVAMTGDGVNDAPALKKADIGIAMGISGTDVAKEASDMILTDDNFASIVNAVEEGRGIFDNIKKFVEYLLSSNLGEILVIFFAIIIGWPLPLVAIQILWINLLTDGFPALALGVDPAEKDIMSRKPRKKSDPLLSKYVLKRMVIIGFIMMLGTLFLFRLFDPANNLIKAQTVAFTALVMFQLFNVLNCRSENSSIFKVGVLGNKKLVLAIVSSIVLQLVVIYVPFFAGVFKTVPLSGIDWLYIILISSSVLVYGEIDKLFRKFLSKSGA